MEPLKLSGRLVTVLGAGRTGRAVARFLAKQGAHVFVSDQASLSPEIKAEFTSLSIAYEEGSHSERVLDADLIILSPGVPASLSIVLKAKACKIPIIGELELAYQFCKSKNIIAITGTNGKTMTTHLIRQILLKNGFDVVTAGNIGTPFITQLEKIKKNAIVVLETSSFQLESISSFRPHISVLLNFSQNHLDRHGSLEDYFKAKCNIFKNQTEEDFAVVCRNLKLPAISAKLIFFDAADCPLPMKNNLRMPHRENLAAAITVCRLLKKDISLDAGDVEKVLALPHHLEFVAEVNGVKFYNDSEATNVAATMAAVNSFTEAEIESLVLILGGRDKGQAFDELAHFIRMKGIQQVLLMGEAQEKLACSLAQAGYKRFSVIKDLREGVKWALQSGVQVCLLSPACASFDMFANLEARGEAFKEAVKAAAPASDHP